MFKLVH